MDRRQSPSRAGFTLVEVLIAILIIALLVAILLPAVRGAFRKAQEAQVSTEITNLATALASFKNTYGDYPPSRIILCETGYSTDSTVNTNATALYSTNSIPVADSASTDITYAQLTQRTLLYLRRFWPRVNFNAGYDFNNNGPTPSPYILSGSECLVFFLGGVPLPDGSGGFGMTGFSKLPTNPFISPSATTAGPAASNRTVPNYEFNAGRLVDLDNDGIPSYLDPADTTPGNRRSYAYFASYGSNGYDPNDVNGLGKHFNPSDAAADYEHEDPNDETTPISERGFTTTSPASSGSYYVVSPGPNPYCTTIPAIASGTTGIVSWINPNSFQLFSAGEDRLWGIGGTYLQGSLAAAGKLPIAPGDAGIVNTGPTSISNDFMNGIRNRESDNVTNFSGGRLD